LPIVSAWLVPLYFHGVQFLYLRRIVPSGAITSLFFLPVLLYEFLSTRAFFRSSPNAVRKRPWRLYLSYGGNLVFWGLCFLVWVLYVGWSATAEPIVQYYMPQFYVFSFLLWRSAQWMTLFCLALWLVSCYVIVVRWRRMRLITTVVLPVLLTVALFLQQFYFGGLGGKDTERISRQPGVTTFLDQPELAGAVAEATATQRVLLDAEAENRSIEIKYHPRDILIDRAGEAFIAVFGCTYCNPGAGWNTPIIVRKSWATGDMRFVLGYYNIRQIDETDDLIYAAPWYSRSIFVIDKHDLAVLQTIPNQISKKTLYWEPMAVLKDVERDVIYVGNEMNAAVLAYDLATGKLRGILDLEKGGYVGAGGTANSMVQSTKTRRVYFIGLPGPHDLFEMDPDTLTITRALDLDDVFGTALVIDQDKETLYYQSGYWDSLYQIDIPTFSVVREYDGVYHARRMRLDKDRNALYLLSFITGEVVCLDLASGNTLWRVDVGGRAHGLALVDDTLWVNSVAGVFRLDLPVIWQSKTGK
jgi:outer membrane protein assembly factor BamB